MILTPVFLVLALMAFQAALWTHVRTEARAVARDAAALVARSGGDPDEVARSATSVLRADTDLADPVVTVESNGSTVVVTVSGRAPGMVRGTASSVRVVEALPLEGYRP